MLWEGLGAGLEELGPKEARLFGWVGQQPDAREGVVSFLDKRDPDWKLSVQRDMPELP
jgi:hypothetical protein